MNRTKLIGLMIITLMFCGQALAQQMEFSAQVKPLKGKVTVTAPGGSARQISQPTRVKAGATVTTAAQSEAMVQFSNGHALKMMAFTNIKIQDLSQNLNTGSENSKVAVWNGDVVANAKKMMTPDSKFSIETPSAVAGVRGTTFRITVSASQDTTFSCTEGSLEITAAGSTVIVPAGMTTQVINGQAPPPPQPLPQGQIDEINAVREEISPEFSLEGVSDNMRTSQASIEVRGRIAKGVEAEIQIALEGQETKINAGADGSFSMTVNLHEGENRIVASVTTASGAMSQKIIRIIRTGPGPRPEGGQGAGPQLSIVRPTAATTREDSVEVAGKTSPGASVDINGSPARTSADGDFAATVNLTEGENLITVKARNSDNLSTSATRMVVRDTTPPMLIINQPDSNFRVERTGAGACLWAQGRIECRALGITDADARLKINGTTYAVDPDGSFSHTALLDRDASTLRFEVSDALGNSQSLILNRSIRYDEAFSLKLTASKTRLVSNGVDSAVVSVQVLNFMDQPVSGANVQLSLNPAGAGTLAAMNLVTDVSGMAQTVLTAGTLWDRAVAAVSASSGGVSASAQVEMTPEVPPTPGD